VPDLIVGCSGRNLLVECKSPVAISHRNQGKDLTEEQVQFHAEWRGEIALVRSIEDVVNLVKQTRREAGP